MQSKRRKHHVRHLRFLTMLSLCGLLAFGVAACGGDDDEGNGGGEAAEQQENLSGTIQIDGSSTVAPLAEAAAELFQEENSGVRVTVGTSGTGGGFEKFCRGEIDIADASRPIKDEEIEACEEAGIEYDQLGVSNDGLAIAVNPENDWAECVSVEELSTAWDRGSDVDNWSAVRDGFPNEKLELFGPGSDSGTFDYFTEAVNGEEGQIRTDYNNIGEDDNAAITGVSGTKGGMGFIPLSFVRENEDKVKAIQVRNEAGDCVEPTEETVQDGSYNPLGRQLFMYPKAEALGRPEVRAFLEFVIENNDEITEAANFIALNDEQRAEASQKVEQLGQAGGGAANGTETTE
jgi:phosphate transport system substrate-binding protein